MHAPREPHLSAMKRILRYLRSTLDHGLLLRPSSPSELVVYTNADWAGCPDTRKSTSGFVVFLGSNLVSWSSKRQTTVSRSNAELSTGRLPMVLLRLAGCDSSFWNFTVPSHALRSSIVAMSVLCISLAIRFSINIRSMSRLIFTLFVSVLPLVTFVCFASRRHLSLQTSSPRVYQPQCSQNSGPV